MLLAIVIIVAATALGAWILWLVHESEPIEIDAKDD